MIRRRNVVFAAVVGAAVAGYVAWNGADPLVALLAGLGGAAFCLLADLGSAYGRRRARKPDDEPDADFTGLQLAHGILLVPAGIGFFVWRLVTREQELIVVGPLVAAGGAVIVWLSRRHLRRIERGRP